MFVLLLALVQGNLFLNPLGVGSSCPDAGIVFVNSYTVTPYPPGCVTQSVQMIGTFNKTFCVDTVFVRQIFNNQDINDQTVPVSKCYSTGEQVNFIFQVSPAKCVTGTYTIQTSVMSHTPAVALGCWQYSYILS